MVKIEIDGREIKARDGTMIIEAADEAGINIPRFCYHKKLSVAANCRMCLVEVDKARKPLPACATPVTDGMKIYTQSPIALSAQKGVMEFLLINHPLDCPICDQGGECELQDVAMGYGRDISRYTEGKRVVPDKNIGSLIATDMTRCIHCTRCVRFGEEVAGVKELGATGRGEHMKIGTYVEATIDSELSGNMIDLCPVGALTSKPFRFAARAWEMQQRATVAPHDIVGSNINVHVKGREIMRVVPRDNEDVNETWISDRDRFSYQAVNHPDRITTPMIKENGQWRATDWETALSYAVTSMQKLLSDNPDQLGVLASANATVEESYLLQKLVRGVGASNIDHRTRQTDFRLDDIAPVAFGLGQTISNLEKVKAALLIGSNARKDQPLIGHRIRKAALHGAKVSFINSMDYEFRYKPTHKIIVKPSAMVMELAGIVKALLASANGPEMPGLDQLLGKVEVNPTHEAIARELCDVSNSTILLGTQAMSHPQFSVMAMLAMAAAQLSDSKFGYLPPAGNSVGASFAGALPNRGPGGSSVSKSGLNAQEMLRDKLKGYLLFGLEPEYDCADSAAALAAMKNAEMVVAVSSFKTEAMLDYANVILPMGTFAETAGTFVNGDGRWQSFEGVMPPRGDARPGWKILRVLGNLLAVDGFDFLNIEEVHEEARRIIGESRMDTSMAWRCPSKLETSAGGIERIGDLPMYSVDALVRRAQALQHTLDALQAAVYVNESFASKEGLTEKGRVTIKQGDRTVSLPVVYDNRVPDECVFVPISLNGLENFGVSSGAVELQHA